MVKVAKKTLYRYSRCSNEQVNVINFKNNNQFNVLNQFSELSHYQIAK